MPFIIPRPIGMFSRSAACYSFHTFQYLIATDAPSLVSVIHIRVHTFAFLLSFYVAYTYLPHTRLQSIVYSYYCV